jgi:hypothetical protein
MMLGALLQEMKSSKLRQLFTMGKYTYRGAAFAYSAFAVYQNPWLVRAVVSSMWAAANVLYQLLR